MHIARQNPTEIVVQDGVIWMSLLFSAGAIAVGIAAFVQGKPKGMWGVVLLLLFAAITARHTTVRFDGLQQMVLWRSWIFFKVKSGKIPFGAITDIVIEALAGGSRSGEVTYRLAMVSPNGSTPMACSYSGGTRERFEKLREQLLQFIKPGEDRTQPRTESGIPGIPASLESSLRALLAQGRKIDAISLLRSSQHIGLTDAVQRIDALNETANP